jgi:hypothetical protein
MSLIKAKPTIKQTGNGGQKGEMPFVSQECVLI